ncbi:MAG: aminotransferase class III-fold pyridoxal phosphate-dependent enzyme [Alphaproteobacteria bacterium]
MPDAALTNSPNISAYRQKTPGSEALWRRAQDSFPSGITHDSRHLEPYGVYIDHALGPRKWDVDGNEYVDYFGGHGALILGHNHPVVAEAVTAAYAKGTHFGASHALEIEWAEQVRRMVPCAEKVRFTSSGTEATLMAVRLARAYTKRPKIVRFRTHFHGWNDHMAPGQANHFDGSATAGVLDGVASAVRLVDPNDKTGLAAALAEGDVAGVILEPTGSSTGMVPIAPGFLEFLRDATSAAGALLIFDEVVTGFRVAPGGAQEATGVTPDLATFAKIIAGGLPGGAVAGKAEIFDLLDFEKARAGGFEKIGHQGTYNANPVAAAAGLAALKLIAAGGVCDKANAYGDAMRAGFNDVIRKAGVPWAAYGEHSAVHIFTNPEGRDVDPDSFDALSNPFMELKANARDSAQKLRLAMLTNGVDITGWPGGTISASHGDAELAETLTAFETSLRMLKDEGVV